MSIFLSHCETDLLFKCISQLKAFRWATAADETDKTRYRKRRRRGTFHNWLNIRSNPSESNWIWFIAYQLENSESQSSASHSVLPSKSAEEGRSRRNDFPVLSLRPRRTLCVTSQSVAEGAWEWINQSTNLLELGLGGGWGTTLKWLINRFWIVCQSVSYSVRLPPPFSTGNPDTFAGKCRQLNTSVGTTKRGCFDSFGGTTDKVRLSCFPYLGLVSGVGRRRETLVASAKDE